MELKKACPDKLVDAETAMSKIKNGIKTKARVKIAAKMLVIA